MKNNGLISFRKSKNLNMKEMYAILGVSKSYYEKVEYGINSAGKGFINKMLTAFPEEKEDILKLFF